MEGRRGTIYPVDPTRDRVGGAAATPGHGRGARLGVEPLDEVINPFVLYAGVALGAVGVWLALPRRGVNPQILGALLALAAGGLVLLGLGLRASESDALPNVYFYIFAAIALGACLRVITHQRPVYAALYFILAILACAGLYLILSAEFMAFALIIIYAGAILITYLFVIMLATQAPTEDQLDALSDYDAQAREPLIASGVGFALLAALTGMIFSGSPRLPDPEHVASARPGDAVLRDLPERVERALRAAGLIEDDQAIDREADGRAMIDPASRTAVVEGEVVEWPDDLSARNVESLAFDFLNRHPGSIEIAGVILLMAMLGAVVLSRRQVEIDEEAKARQARRLAAEEGL